MAGAHEYAKWIVANQDKKGTPEFETVAKAYQVARGQPQQEPTPEPQEPTLPEKIGNALKSAYSLTPAGMAMKGVEAFEQGAYDLGGAVTDNTGSPVAGMAANMFMQSIPVLAGGAVGSGAKVPLQNAGRGLMDRALKAPAVSKVGGLESDAAKAVQTLLDEGVNVSTAGAVKLRTKINQLESEVQKRISASNAVVDKSFVMKEVHDTLQKFRNQVNDSADVAKIMKSWEETSAKLAAKIPVQEAHALKQGTYKILSDKYAKMGAVENEASTQAQMAAARGLRLGTEDVLPEVGKLTAKESELINALELAERRAGIGGNKDIGGIAWLAQNPTAAAAMMADRSSAFKSALARLLYRTGKGPLPSAVGSGVGGVVSTAISGNE